MWPGTIPFTVSRNAESGARRLYYACGVNGFNFPVTPVPSLPATVRVPKPGRRQIKFHASQEHPGWRPLVGQLASPVLGQAIMGERLGCGRGQRAKTLRGTVDDRDRHFGRNASPILPAVELREIVSAHDPDQAQAGSAAAQICNRVEGIAGADDSFETADIDARIVGHQARSLGAFVEIVQAAVLLERIARGHQPPYPVEVQSLECKQADGAMRGVWRIERAAEQTVAHALAE